MYLFHYSSSLSTTFRHTRFCTYSFLQFPALFALAVKQVRLFQQPSSLLARQHLINVRDKHFLALFDRPCRDELERVVWRARDAGNVWRARVVHAVCDWEEAGAVRSQHLHPLGLDGLRDAVVCHAKPTQRVSEGGDGEAGAYACMTRVRLSFGAPVSSEKRADTGWIFCALRSMAPLILR